jgi:hypothetical protein
MTQIHPIPLLLSLLGALTLTACGDHHDKSKPGAASFDQVAQIVARRNDRVSVDELARWIIQGKQNFVLIDVRPPTDFAAGHIQGARNLSVPELIAPEQQKTLPKDRKVIVYSQGSETAAQAVVLLRLAGLDADLLLGGYNFWNQHVLNPAVYPTLADDEYPSATQKQATACYFLGGNSQTQTATPSPVKPAFVPPLAQPALAPPPKAHEGC